MKHRKIKGLLSAFLLAAIVFFGGVLTAHSENEQTKFSIPSLNQKTAPLKPEEVKVVPIKPGDEIPDWVARWELARVLSYVKRYEASIAEYKKVLKEKPDLTEAKLEMAKVLFWDGEQKKALGILEQISPKTIPGETKVLMADLFVAQKDYAKAEPLYREYLKGHPHDHSVRLKLAEMLSWQKDYDTSLKEYRKILEAHPNDIQVRRRYAFVLIWAGEHEEAASQLKRTLD